MAASIKIRLRIPKNGNAMHPTDTAKAMPIATKIDVLFFSASSCISAAFTSKVIFEETV